MIDYISSLTPPPANPAQFIPPQMASQLGRGLKVPTSMLDDETWATCEGKEKVEQDMLICLATPVNRRLGQSDYGSILPHMVFGELTDDLLIEMQTRTREALKAWVPQITVNVVKAFSLADPTNSDNAAVVMVGYTIKATAFQGQLAVTVGNDGVKFSPNVFTVNGQQIIKE